MGRSLRYHPLFASDVFASDVLAAAEWYDGRLPDLGADFVTRVQRAVDRVLTDPESRTPLEFGFRCLPVQRFPYVVFYALTDTELLILGVMHTSQESGRWLSERR